MRKISELFKKRQPAPAQESASETLYLETRPEIKEGYHEDENVIVRLVSPRKKDEKPYQVHGIEDVVAKNNWKGWLYLAPVIILIAVFLIYPLINTIFIAFTDNYQYATGKFDGLTFKNFTYILGLTTKSNGARETYFTRYAIPNTFILVFVTVPISTALALLISVALNSIKWFQKILQTIFFLPYVTNAIAVGMVFAVLFDYKGILNYLLGLGTLTWIDQAAPAWRGMIALCVYIIWHSLPFKILIFLSGLQNIDKQYYDAAKIDCAGKMKTMLNVTVPLLSPQILYIMITSFIGSFKEYTSVVGLFGQQGTSPGSYNMYTVVYYIYDMVNSNVQYGAAAAVLLFLVIMLFTAIQFKVSKTRVHY